MIRASITTALVAGALAGCQCGTKERSTPIVAEPLVVTRTEVFPRLYAAKISRLAIARQSEPSVVLERQASGRWRLVEPIAEDADQRAVKFALSELERLEWVERAVAHGPDRWADYQATPAEVVTLTVTHDGTALAPIHLAQKRVARIGDHPDLFTIHHVSHFTFARELRFWRDRVVSHFEPAEVTAVELVLGARRALIDRVPAAPPTADQPAADPDGWTLREAKPALTAVDAEAMNLAFRRMISLEGQDIVAIDRAAAGLDAPRARIILHRGEARTELRLGADAPDGGVYAGDDQRPRVLLLSRADAALIAPDLWR
ncbi:MAG TPA: hypothetical protein VML75_18340 [Kofleriaceae bacterium]|nr:hypothetical protein [Kofleriaceae bacterium]